MIGMGFVFLGVGTYFLLHTFIKSSEALLAGKEYNYGWTLGFGVAMIYAGIFLINFA